MNTISFVRDEIRELWARALRSGRYVQGRSVHGFLCFLDEEDGIWKHDVYGVLLAELLTLKDEEDEDDNPVKHEPAELSYWGLGEKTEVRYRSFDGDVWFLSPEVREFIASEGRVPQELSVGDIGLSALNLTLTFEQLADRISTGRPAFRDTRWADDDQRPTRRRQAQ